MDKNLKLGLISGIISSVIVLIFIQPLLSFLWNVFVAVAGSIHQGYVDRIYRHAALSDRNPIALVTIIFLLLLNLLILPGVASSLTAADPKVHVWSRLFQGIALIVTVCFLTVSLFLCSLAVGVMEISASFSQRLTMLAPAIDDHEYKVFRARWANMKGVNDYNSLVTALDAR